MAAASEGRLPDTVLRAIESEDLGALTSWLIDPNTHIEDTEAGRGHTALLWASRTGRLKSLLVLAKSGADVNAAITGGAAALYIAAQEGHHQVVSTLLENGAQIDHRHSNGATALFIAAAAGRTEVVRCLLAAGSDAGLATSSGHNAMQIAKTAGHGEVVALLQRHGDENKQALAGMAVEAAADWLRSRGVAGSAADACAKAEVDGAGLLELHTLVCKDYATFRQLVMSDIGFDKVGHLLRFARVLRGLGS